MLQNVYFLSTLELVVSKQSEKVTKLIVVNLLWHLLIIFYKDGNQQNDLSVLFAKKKDISDQLSIAISKIVGKNR